MSNPHLTLNFTLRKTTKGTFVFEPCDGDAPITALYIKKSAVPHGTDHLQLQITFDTEEEVS